MANNIASALLAAQAKIMPNFTDAEMRERQNPILRTGFQNQSFLMTDVKSIKESTKRAVKGYQRIRRAAGNATSRTHNFTSTQGDTMEVTLNWNTITERFSVYWDTGADNIFSTQDNIADGFRQAMLNIRERSGAALLTYLHANRNQVANAVVRNATFSAANDAFEITQAGSVPQFFAYLKSVMSQHKYQGSLDVLVDSVLDPVARMIAAQGSSNGANLSYQIQGQNIMPHDTLGTDIGVDAYPNGGIALALPASSFAFIPWIPKKYYAGEGNVDDVNGKRFVLSDDSGLPVTYGAWGYTEKADGSGVNGTTDDMVTHFQVSYDVAPQVAAMSTANETPIFEFALVG